MFHLFGIDVYADIVLNHLMGADAMEQVITYKVDAYHRHKESKRKRVIRASTYFSFPSRNAKFMKNVATRSLNLT